MKTLEQFLSNLRENTIAYYVALEDEHEVLVKAFLETIESEEFYLTPRSEQRTFPNVAKYEDWKDIQTKGDLEMIRILRSYPDDFYKKVDREIEAKRKKLISSIEKKAGEIISVQFMDLGVDGELNGVVTGSKNTVSVNTIYAGGYNIQKLHYRTLIKVL